MSTKTSTKTNKAPKLSTINRCRIIVRAHQYEKIDGVIVDATTANLIVKVYDVLNETNALKFATLPTWRMVNLAWKLAV